MIISSGNVCLGFETGSLTGLVSSRLTLGQGAPGIHFYRLPQYWDYKNTWLFTWLLGVKLVLLLTWWLLKQGLGLASRASISLALEYLFYWNTEVFSWFLFKVSGEDTFPPPPQVIGIITLTPAIVVPMLSHAPAIKTARLKARHTQLRLRLLDLVLHSPLISSLAVFWQGVGCWFQLVPLNWLVSSVELCGRRVCNVQISGAFK